MACEPVLAAGGPPAGLPVRHCAHLELPPTPSSVGAARRLVREQAAGLPAAVVDVAQLLTSELVTNGVLHARTPLQVGVSVAADLLLVSVADHGPGEPVRRERDLAATGGRGMEILAELADDYGVAKAGEGKSVWFVLKAMRERAEGGQ